MTGSELAYKTGISLWRQIAERLEQDVASGKWSGGERLPGEMQMAARFGVNRHTVRRAIAHLVEMGLLRVEQGRGAYLAEEAIDYRISERTRFSENMEKHQLDYQGSIIKTSERVAENAIAEALGLPHDATLLMIERVNQTDGRPLSVSSHYFPAERFSGLSQRIAETGSITKALAHFGVNDYKRKRTSVTARIISPRDARILRISPGKPVLLTEGLNVDAGGVPIEFSVARWAWDRVQITFEN